VSAVYDAQECTFCEKRLYFSVLGDKRTPNGHGIFTLRLWAGKSARHTVAPPLFATTAVQYDGERYVTMIDPEGHPFCLC
jgi:hypothetical protein